MQAVARHAAVGRLQADDAAQRRRLTDRSAGVGAERQRRHARRHRRRRSAARCRPACGRAPTGCAPGRTPSSRSTSPSRTRRSWSCRRSTAPAASRRATTVASYGGTYVSSIRDEAVVRTPRGAEVVLERDRHAGQRRVAPSARSRSIACGARERALAGDGVEGVEPRVERVDARERVAADLDARAVAATRPRRALGESWRARSSDAPAAP